MTRQWADQPFPLLPSPTDIEGISAQTVNVATGMCFGHNLMLRSLNAIILQYAQLTLPSDISDFLIFCQCWHEMVHHHHHFEETFFFPAIEAYSGEKGIMEGNIEQQHAFEEGLKKFGEYVYEVKAKDWAFQSFKEILESFTTALTTHLREEIPTLLALDRFGGEKLQNAWDELEKMIVKGPMDPYRVIPMGLGNFDSKYDQGQRPPFPFFVPYLSHYWFSRRHKGAWRFCSTTFFGKRKELPFAKDK